MVSKYDYPRRITIPRVRESRLSLGWNNIQTDGDLITADSPELTLTIVGTGGISTSESGGQLVIDGSGIAGADWNEDEFSPSDDQISFSLSEAPTDGDSVFFIINGVIYDDTDDYTVSGQTVTWTDALFNMQTTDKVIIKYV